MLLTIFMKECKQIVRSLVFYLYLLVFIFFLTSQMGNTQIIKEPKPGAASYGIKQSTDSKIIMSVTLSWLINEIRANNFATAPIGFYKKVILSQNERSELKKIVEECTGKEWDIIDEEARQYEQEMIKNNGEELEVDSVYEVTDIPVSYKFFEVQMKKVSDIVGKGSRYDSASYKHDVEEPITYDEALAEYHDICDMDGITDAYMRLFCDYAGVVLALLPIFLGVTRCVRDKRSKADLVIYSKSISSFQVILSRYLANAFMIFVPELILAFMMQTPYMYQADTIGVRPHYFSFLVYSVIWILPTILFVLAVSFLLTESINGVVAVIVQVFFALGSFMASSASSLSGIFKMQLIPRWNCFGNPARFMNEKMDLYFNRGAYVIIAIIVIAITSILYDWKRRGGMFYAKKH